MVLEPVNNISDILEQALAAVRAAENLASLDQVRINYLGKKGHITQLLKQLARGCVRRCDAPPTR